MKGSADGLRRVTNEGVFFLMTATLAVTVTPREREVLSLVAEGLTNQEISGVLDISFHTVRSHLGNAFNHLGVRNRMSAVAVMHQSEDSRMKKIGELPSGRVVFIDGSAALDTRDALSLAHALIQEHAPHLTGGMVVAGALARLSEELGLPPRIANALERALIPNSRPRRRRPRRT